MAQALAKISVLFTALLTVAALGAGAAWWLARSRVAKPPAIETLGSMDPEVAALLQQLRAAVERDPNDAGARGRFGMACEANGLIGAAREAYETASRLAPAEPRWAYRLALVASRLGNHDAALIALSRANDLAPTYGPAWSRLGFWLLDRGDASGAEAAFQRAVTLEGGGVSGSIGIARVHLHRRDDHRALELLEQLLERRPGDRYALQLLGTAYRRVGRMDDAVFALAVGAAGEPAWHDPWSEEVAQYRRGFAATLKAATAEAMAGRFDRALPLLQQLRARNPADVSLANQTAEVLTAGGHPREAIEILASLVDAHSDNADTQLALASAHLASGDGARAETHADRAIILRATGARALELKGLIAWRSGRLSQASALFEQGLARDPRHVRLLAWIGLIDLEARRPRDAAAAFAEVIRRDPLQADALAGLAMAQHALGGRREAALALARAEQVAAGHPRVREARAFLEGAPRR